MSRNPCWGLIEIGTFQDLYKVGDYDSDDGEMWDDDYEEPPVGAGDICDVSDDDGGSESWETESEHSVKDEEDATSEDNNEVTLKCLEGQHKK